MNQQFTQAIAAIQNGPSNRPHQERPSVISLSNIRPPLPQTKDAPLTLQLLIDEILRGIKICREFAPHRSHKGSNPTMTDLPLANQQLHKQEADIETETIAFPLIQRQIYQRLRQQIEVLLIEDGALDPAKESAQWAKQEWAKHVRDRAYRKVLDEATLTRMAIAIQVYPASSLERRKGAAELVTALTLSDRITKRRSPEYAEALNRTLSHVYEKLDQFTPEKASLLAWVNYWLDIYLRRLQAEQEDPLIQSSVARIIREKNKLKKQLRWALLEDVLAWLTLVLKYSQRSNQFPSRQSHPNEHPPKNAPYFTLLLTITTCFLWGKYMREHREKMDTYLFELAQQSLGLPSKISTVSQRDTVLDRVAAPGTPTFLSDDLRHYFETDPDGLLQKHIQGHPQATLQAIALAYLDGTSWKSLSTTWGIPIPSLSSFFQRQLKALAPKVKKSLQA